MRRLGIAAGVVSLVALIFTLDRGAALFAAPVYERATLQSGEDFWHGRPVAHVADDDRSIPAQLPGPADGWAGGERKSIALTITPPVDFGRGWLLKIGILDSHDTAPPVIEIVAGSLPPTVIAIRPGHGSTHWLTDGLRSHIELLIQHDALVEGRLPVTIRSLSGSWIALQQVELIAAVPSWEYDAAVALWLIVVIGYAVVATRARLWGAHVGALVRRWNGIVGAVASRIDTPGRAALFVFVAMQIFFGLQREWIVPHDADFERRYYYMVGDEPEYFLGAWSLAYDGDMNIRNDVVEGSWKNFWNQQVWDYYFGSLAHFKTMSQAMADVPEETWEGMQLMVHRPGMSALIFPAAYNVDQFRWTGYVITTTVAACAVAALVWLAGAAGVSTAGAALIALLFAATPLSFSTSIRSFPKPPSASGWRSSRCCSSTGDGGR